MNYKKIYYRFCEYFKNSTPEERLRNRNPLDTRINQAYMYTEKHHIVPRHDGGSDSDDNLVVVLPEEHLFIHTVRYKAYGNRSDFLSVRYMINGYLNNRHPEFYDLSNYGNTLTKRIGIYRSLISSFRKDHGWQSEDGRRRISESRKNKMPCIDSKTGEKVGIVTVDHPNIISGLWIHHSKGKISVTEKSTGKRKYITTDEYKNKKDLYTINSRPQDGENNGNYKEMTDKHRHEIFSLVKDSIIENHFVKKAFVNLLKEKYSSEFKRISFKWIENNIGDAQQLVEETNNFFNTEYKYNPYFRSTEQKEKAKLQESQNIWITNGIENKRIRIESLEYYLKNNPEFYRGRKL